MEKAFLSGNEAVAFGAYEAGMQVACAYPGTPSTEILEAIAEFPEIDAQWSVNEKVAYEVALGAAVGGVRSLYACKHVGLNVAMDPLMTSSYTGINAGFVIVVCDDPGMHSSQNEQDTRWVSLYSKMPMLEPSSPSEAKEHVARAFDISEEFDTPVIVRMTTRISHTKEDMVLGKRVEKETAPLSYDEKKYVMIPAFARKRHVVVEERLGKLKDFAETTDLNEITINDKSVGFLTSSIPYHYLKEEYPDASYLKLGFSYPFCDDKIREFADSVDKLVVVEELDPFFETHLAAMGLEFETKDATFQTGELTPDVMKDVVEGKKRPAPAAVAKRPPRLCPGCPHWFSFATLKKHNIYVAGDIGCYTLASLPPTSAMHTCVCMGAGVTFNEGLRKAHPNEKILGVVGDSTFVHSGVTGLINAAYNGSKGVIMIVDNSITAMTGGQQNPATGLTIRNERTKLLDLEALCKSCGADNVDVIDPTNRKEFDALVEKRVTEDALSVIIAKHPCKLIK
ncbi:2-oxoacid ferredoxin oxidoreductase [Anaerohalosphaera lusitana]|uniref:Indolepyruvate oxidoreductase subunit IorA n=1 Tax=Anaerohalosphaera lusitana TaxID=1936003 RepID=A0A1U9NK55_9BACT|nr:thiamine pyrophosphate-dependent enzyme [Anaerohalosphaera lusitana]AQT68289.1 2-oxoacid ferredoxin oxidoreductase [Anaerohalosphaera lusitana]